MNLRSKKMALLFSTGVLLAMSYVDYSLEKAALEAEYGLKEPINRASPPHIEPAQLSLSLHIELAQWSLKIIAELICAFSLTVYLRTLSVAKRWSFISIFAVANILFTAERFPYTIGKDPYVLRELYVFGLCVFSVYKRFIAGYRLSTCVRKVSIQEGLWCLALVPFNIRMV